MVSENVNSFQGRTTNCFHPTLPSRVEAFLPFPWVWENFTLKLKSTNLLHFYTGNLPPAGWFGGAPHNLLSNYYRHFGMILKLTVKYDFSLPRRPPLRNAEFGIYFSPLLAFKVCVFVNRLSTPRMGNLSKLDFSLHSRGGRARDHRPSRGQTTIDDDEGERLVN